MKYFETPKGYNEVKITLGGKTIPEWFITFLNKTRYTRIINSLQWNGDKRHKWRAFIHNFGSRHRLENEHSKNQDAKGRRKSESRPVADICVSYTEYLGSTEIGNVWVKIAAKQNSTTTPQPSVSATK